MCGVSCLACECDEFSRCIYVCVCVCKYFPSRQWVTNLTMCVCWRICCEHWCCCCCCCGCCWWGGCIGGVLFKPRRAQYIFFFLFVTAVINLFYDYLFDRNHRSDHFDVMQKKFRVNTRTVYLNVHSHVREKHSIIFGVVYLQRAKHKRFKWRLLSSCGD